MMSTLKSWQYLHLGKYRLYVSSSRGPRVLLSLTGESFRVCVQVRARVQLGDVLLLSLLAAAGVTNPQSFIHTVSICRAPMSLIPKGRETDEETETWSKEYPTDSERLQVGQVPRRVSLFMSLHFFIFSIHRSTIYTA